MTEDDRQRILKEARDNLAVKDELLRDLPPRPIDPMIKWRQQAAEFEALEAQGRRELRREEERRRQMQQQDPAAADQWDQRFLDRLQEASAFAPGSNE